MSKKTAAPRGLTKTQLDRHERKLAQRLCLRIPHDVYVALMAKAEKAEVPVTRVVVEALRKTLIGAPKSLFE